jgi:hypothetical protein
MLVSCDQNADRNRDMTYQHLIQEEIKILSVIDHRKRLE